MTMQGYRHILTAIRSELASRGRLAMRGSAWAAQEPFAGLVASRLDAFQLAAVDAALAKIDRGAYGLCSDCGQAISGRRLAAIPWVVRCIACQELSGSRGECDGRLRYDPGDRGSLS